MILGWVDQIGRKGKVISSILLPVLCRCSSLCIPNKEKFTYEKKKKQFPEQFQNNLFITNLLHVPYL